MTPDVEALKRQILAEIQPQLAAANKTFASQFNPAIGFIVDTVFSSSRKDKSNFEFRSAELGISANIDPFARAYGILNGTNDGVEVEEAALVTTSLPYNLTVKGGRFFADFGRLSTFHDHDLPFVNRPLVLDTYVGGESQADGVEVNWLVPIPHYLSVTVGAYNKIGAENDRASNDVPRDPGEFTYLGRIATSFNLGDAHTLDVGISDAFTPLIKSEGRNSRNLAGADLTYRYTPLSSSGYRGLVWGSEFLVNSENSETSAGTFRRATPSGCTAIWRRSCHAATIPGSSTSTSRTSPARASGPRRSRRTSPSGPPSSSACGCSTRIPGRRTRAPTTPSSCSGRG